MSGFEKLAPELVLKIADYLPVHDIAVWVRVCRDLHGLLNPELYRCDLTSERPQCVRWAAHNGRLGTLQRALAARANPNVYCEGFDDEAELVLSIVNANRKYHKYATRDDIDRADPDNNPFYSSPLGTSRPYGTPLHLAALAGNSEIVTALLDAGAVIDAPSRGLCNCVPFGSGFLPTYDWDDVSVDVDWDFDCTFPRWTALHLAICAGHAATAELLVRRGASMIVEDPPLLPGEADPPEELPVADATNALHSAVRRGNLASIKFLLEWSRQKRAEDPNVSPRSIVDVNATNGSDDTTALHFAALYIDEETSPAVVHALFDGGIQDPDSTGLAYACGYRNFYAAAAIAARGPKATDSSRPNQAAAILQYCALPLRRRDAAGHHARAQARTVELLVRRHGLRLDSPPSTGYFALVTAATQRSHPRMLETLLALGAHPDCGIPPLQTPAQRRAAAQAGTQEPPLGAFERSLRQLPEMADGASRARPLRLAVQNGDRRKARALLDAGADPDMGGTCCALLSVWQVWAGNTADDAATMWPLLLWRGTRADYALAFQEVGIHWGDNGPVAWREWRGVFYPEEAAADAKLTDEALTATCKLRFFEAVIGCAAAEELKVEGRIGMSYYKKNLYTLGVLARHAQPGSGVLKSSLEKALRYWAGKRCREVVKLIITLAMKLKSDMDFSGLRELVAIGGEWLEKTRKTTAEWAAEEMPEECRPAQGQSVIEALDDDPFEPQQHWHPILAAAMGVV